jgi:hypothetical protein
MTTCTQSLSTREKSTVINTFVVYVRVIAIVMTIVKTVLFVTSEGKKRSFQAAEVVHRKQKERTIASCLLVALVPASCLHLEMIKRKLTRNFVLEAENIVPRAINVGYVKEIVTLYVNVFLVCLIVAWAVAHVVTRLFTGRGLQRPASLLRARSKPRGTGL